MTPAKQTDYRDDLSRADATAAAAMEAAGIAWIADVDIVYSSALALNLAPRTKEFLVSGAKVGDRVYVHRRAKPTMGGVPLLSGVMIEGTGLVTEAGKVEVYHVIPAVAALQTLTIPLRIIGYRSAS